MKQKASTSEEKVWKEKRKEKKSADLYPLAEQCFQLKLSTHVINKEEDRGFLKKKGNKKVKGQKEGGLTSDQGPKRYRIRLIDLDRSVDTLHESPAGKETNGA